MNEPNALHLNDPTPKPPALGMPPGAVLFAKTTVQSTGVTVTADIYGKGAYTKTGAAAAATITGVTMKCPMVSASGKVAAGTWLIARWTGIAWEGFLPVWNPEPS